MRLRTAESLPFIIDDILINFDEARSRATLAALSALADRMQVILFTHQSQIADMAREMGEGGRVFVHGL